VRKLVLILLIALAVPTVATARTRDRDDGTLAVKSASATIQIKAKGSILGRIDTGTLWVTDWNPTDNAAPQVYGAEKTISKTDMTTMYRGKDIRFRFVSGRYTIRVVGTGIDISAVGSGTVKLTGAGTLDDGSYSLDGAAFKPVPLLLTSGTFGTQPAAVLPIPIGG
jgi:hypothetical protein